MQCSCVDGGEEGSKAILKNLQEVRYWALIECFSYNVSQLPIIY
jgi:hypothetical protein